ncbi:Alpha/Beta hydrolase protein [Roridomyces roridus]|uniref:Carboxylic ester hydrolase n=1 Tax=Roridomyces roridus TaxID=1738132 RepID=A0AAD7BTI4_9AGAR|nr:Alpha/Beta hydrolase protein [Roridomyces roridus]
MFPLLLSGFLSLLVCTDASPIVSLSYGTFQGFNTGNLTAFLGVPFGQAGRFEVPRAPGILHGVQNATNFGPTCPQQSSSLSIPAGVQFPDIGNGETLPDTPVVISEDCLTLDVYKPATASAKSKLPVFVWIYGGGFEDGNSRNTNLDPIVERSISTGSPVVVVAINYRLTAFGFLAGKEVAAAGATNLGTRDQIFALQWVQKNIAAFGGDPTRVVVGGVSAGAISTAILLLDNKPASNTLFHGAFMESGSPATTPSVADGQADFDGLVAANGCSHARDTLDCLRRVPFASLMATINNTPNLFSFQSLNIVWRPRVDGDVIVKDPLISVQEGLYSRMPFLTGDSDDEGTIFTVPLLNITTDAEFLNFVHSNYLPTATQGQIAQVARLYPADPAQGSPFGTGTADQLSPQYKRLAAFQGDLVFVAPRRSFLEHASTRQNTWSWLNRRFKTSSEFGSFHASDETIWFPTEPNPDFTALDALVNFINTLDPNNHAGGSSHSSKVFWPKWNTASSTGPTSLLTFSDPNVINITAENFRVAAFDFLNELLFDEAK